MSFLKQVFGPSKEETWQQLCNEIGAELVKGSFWKGRKTKVIAQIKAWTITLDTYTNHTSSTVKTETSEIHTVRMPFLNKDVPVTINSSKTSRTYTRLRAPYLNQDGFRFKIYRRGLFEVVRKKLFGLEDIQVGYPDFDRDFIIQGNDPHKVMQLFGNPKIRQLI